MCKISIIVPVYNVEKYLEKCITSILEQTFKNFELILVNDGSTDGSGDICNRYQKIDERVKVIYQKNSGLSAARNAGLELAKGDYIGFVDSDDYIHNKMYETMLELAEKNHADIVQCEFKKFYNDFLGDNERNIINKSFTISNSEEALYKLLVIGETNVQCVVSWNKLYKSDLFNDIRFPIGKIHEDEFTTFKLFDKAKKIIFYKGEMYYYRQVDGSIMNSKFSKRRLNYLEAIETQLNYFENRNSEIFKGILLKYELNLKIYYFRVKDNIEDNKDILKEIRKKYYTIFMKICKNNEFETKRKIINSVFLINPMLFRKIQKNRHKNLY